MPLFGAHVSASGGLDKACERAASIGCNAMQIFSNSPRMWRSKSADQFDWEKFSQAKKDFGIESVVIHAMYLINLASNNPELVEKSRNALINDLTIADAGNFEGVVVHLGSHQGRGYESAKDQMVEEIKKILEETPENSILLIENSAGQNGKIASNLEEIRELLDEVDSPRLGWCLDSCHAHAAGYAITPMDVSLFDSSKMLFEEIERLRLWETLKCVHINDSRDPFGSCRDRHENLGKGKILATDMQVLLQHPKLEHVPFILEVPGAEKKGPDIENVALMKEWMGK